MNKIIGNLPFIILTAILPYFFYKEPNIAQSIITLGVCGLSGFSYYLRDKKKPDLEAIFRKQIEDRDLEIFNQIKKQNADIKALKENQGRDSINKMVKSKLDDFSWNNM